MTFLLKLIQRIVLHNIWFSTNEKLVSDATLLHSLVHITNAEIRAVNIFSEIREVNIFSEIRAVNNFSEIRAVNIFPSFVVPSQLCNNLSHAASLPTVGKPGI